MADLLWQDLHDQLAQHQGRSNTQNGLLGKRSRAGTTPGIDFYNDGEEGDLGMNNGEGDDGMCFLASLSRSWRKMLSPDNLLVSSVNVKRRLFAKPQKEES